MRELKILMRLTQDKGGGLNIVIYLKVKENIIFEDIDGINPGTSKEELKNVVG